MTHQTRLRWTAALMGGAILGLGFGGTAVAAVDPTATLTATGTCTDDAWKGTWTLTPSGAQGAEGTLSGVGFVVEGSPATLDTFAEGRKIIGNRTLSESRTFVDDNALATLELTVTWTIGGKTTVKTLRADAAMPDECPWMYPRTRPDKPPELNRPEKPTKPEKDANKPAPAPEARLIATSGCTEFTVSLTVKARTKGTVLLKLTTGTGDERVLAARPGGSDSQTFTQLKRGAKVKVTPLGDSKGRKTTLKYQPDPKCRSLASAAGAGGGGRAAAGRPVAAEDTLPVTGVQIGIFVAIAVGLLGAGVMVAAAAWRQRVKFTA